MSGVSESPTSPLWVDKGKHIPCRVYKGLLGVPGGSVKGLQGTNDGMSGIN